MIHVRGIDIHVEINGDEYLPVIVFLHGFTGSTATWSTVSSSLGNKFRTVAIDLLGHGDSAVPEHASRYSMEEQVQDLEQTFKELGLTHFTLIGYSMGGRVALGYTVNYPQRVLQLVLESSSPGLQTKEEQTVRRESDSRLAARIREEGLHSFVDFWEELALFQSQKTLPETTRRAIRKERLQQSVTGLSNSLIGIGTGSQPSYWNRVETVLHPVLLITGELDMKFKNIAREMKQHFPIVRHITVENAGHAIHVEKPHLFATMVEEHILSWKK
ncbi:2-succinyl-6-hydroxy-2,4-cyclohexadiene-1-carboxylate synthase [Filibacter tadaridae]|nr:2-succinyl-6-hydroxy-2,4-cyclohexadiene-1-carboxylate synthase [Filibacter tadaridae]